LSEYKYGQVGRNVAHIHVSCADPECVRKVAYGVTNFTGIQL